MQGGWQPPPGGGGGGYGGGGGSYGPQSYVPNPYGGPTAPSPQFQQAPQGPQYGGYEFNQHENSVIDRCASRAKLWGWISAALGIFQIFGSCGMFSNALFGAYLPAGIVAIVVGFTFVGVGNSLKAIVSTQGNDIQHTMQAFQKLSSAFIVQIICAVVGLVVAVVVILIAMLFLVANAAVR